MFARTPHTAGPVPGPTCMYGTECRTNDVGTYEACANREFPLSRLPYLKNRIAARWNQ
jgi:hypothetical protein